MDIAGRYGFCDTGHNDNIVKNAFLYKEILATGHYKAIAFIAAERLIVWQRNAQINKGKYYAFAINGTSVRFMMQNTL